VPRRQAAQAPAPEAQPDEDLDSQAA
jgi:hypothetical protein